ncbi:MAG TPA: hypothetical protein VGF65_03315 [Mycobacterium sp.]
MNHAHWWLFALSFAMGLVLTLALIVRPVKRQVRVGKSAPTESEPTTTKIPVPEEPETTRIRVAKDGPTTRIPVAKESSTTKIPVTRESPTMKIPTVPSAPYGPGSAQAMPDGGGPAGWLVKGHLETRLYYTPDDPTYDSTVPQVWFKDEESAVRAGFTPWRKRSKKG